MDIIASVIFMQTMRWTQHAHGHMAWVAFINYSFAAMFYLPLYAMPAHHGTTVTIMGAVVGVLYALNFFLAMAVIRTNGIALTSAITVLATVIPVLVSIASGDPWGDRTPGLALAAIAAPMLILGRSTNTVVTRACLDIRSAVRIFVLLIFIGTQMSLFKVARHLGGDGYEHAFLPALFMAAALTSCGPALFAGHRALRRGDVARGLVLGTCNISANYCFTQALMVLSGVVAFPVRHIATVACTTVLGYLLWRERVNRIGLAGIALGLAAAVLLTIAGDPPPLSDIGQ